MTRLEELEELEKMAWRDYDTLRDELQPRLEQARARWLVAVTNKSREETRVRIEDDLRAEIKAELAKDMGAA